MVTLGRVNEMYIKFQFLGSRALYLRKVGRYNLACLFLFKAQTQIINIVMPNLFYDL